ncbi:hypothetical protein Chor_010446 [Crotalus horridus]
MKPGASCLRGSCCEECKLLTEGTVCRAAVSDCDLDEYCSGTSETCPPDVFKQNGMPCGLDSTCYSGVCLDIRRHCQTFFGKGKRALLGGRAKWRCSWWGWRGSAKPAPFSCYKEVNLQGDRTGNCGQDRSGYRKCQEKDASCGRLQCTNVHKIPRIPPGFSILQTPVEEGLCWSIISPQRDDGSDDGAAKEGSSCGPRKVCNSKTNCHCSYGWAPPHCSGRGFGGSVDSGPAPERVSNGVASSGPHGDAEEVPTHVPGLEDRASPVASSISDGLEKHGPASQTADRRVGKEATQNGLRFLCGGQPGLESTAGRRQKLTTD